MSVSIQIMSRNADGDQVWYDITEQLRNQGVPFPDNLGSAIYPDSLMTGEEYQNAPKFYDLLGAISEVDGLKDTFFDGSVHPLRLVDSEGSSFQLRVLIETRYTSRNN